MPRFGARIMLQIGLAWFAVGNLLCGTAVDVGTLSAAKLVEGIGKGMVTILCRSTLYRHCGGRLPFSGRMDSAAW